MTKLFNVQLKEASATPCNVNSLEVGDHFKDGQYSSTVHTFLARCPARCLVVSSALGRYSRSQVKDSGEAGRVDVNKISLLSYSTKVYKCASSGLIIKDEIEPCCTGELSKMCRGAVVKCCQVYDSTGNGAGGDYPRPQYHGDWFTVLSEPGAYDNSGVWIQSMVTLRVFRGSGRVRYCQYKPEDITIKNV